MPDEKDEAEKLRRVQFSARAREALAEAMNNKGGALSPLEAKGTIYGLLNGFQYKEKGWLYDSTKDVTTFEAMSEPGKYQTVALMNANKQPIGGEFGGNLELDIQRNRVFETVKSTNEAVPAEVRAAAKNAEAEGGGARHDRQDNLFVVSFKNRMEIYNRSGKLLDNLEFTARNSGESNDPELPNALQELKAKHRDAMRATWNSTLNQWIVDTPGETQFYDRGGKLLSRRPASPKYQDSIHRRQDDLINQ